MSVSCFLHNWGVSTRAPGGDDVEESVSAWKSGGAFAGSLMEQVGDGHEFEMNGQIRESYTFQGVLSLASTHCPSTRLCDPCKLWRALE